MKNRKTVNGNTNNLEVVKIIRLEPSLKEHGMAPVDLELAVHRYNEIYGDGIFLDIDDADTSKISIYRYSNVDTQPFWDIFRSFRAI